MDTQNLLSPIKLGDLNLKNRIFMSPMTRTRVDSDDVLLPFVREYYSQRASAGLIISEATYIAPGGKVRISQPGIFTNEQIEAWRKVTDAVHMKDGVIFAQLSHSGRSAMPVYNKGLHPIAPSALTFDSGAHGSTDGNSESSLIPKALNLSEIGDLIEQFRQAAVNAKAAGFDGVELHAGNAGLVEQFLHEVSNVRIDDYGSSIENRAKFLLQVIDALISVFEKERVGLRLSPHDRLSDQNDPDPLATTTYIAKEMNQRGISYINVLEPNNKSDAFIPYPEGNPSTLANIRAFYNGVLIANGGYTQETGNKAVENRAADAIAYGRVFLANPDLPYRFRHNLPLNSPDMSTFYGYGKEGYLDYTILEKENKKL